MHVIVAKDKTPKRIRSIYAMPITHFIQKWKKNVATVWKGLWFHSMIQVNKEYYSQFYFRKFALFIWLEVFSFWKYELDFFAQTWGFKFPKIVLQKINILKVNIVNPRIVTSLG